MNHYFTLQSILERAALAGLSAWSNRSSRPPRDAPSSPGTVEEEEDDDGGVEEEDEDEDDVPLAEEEDDEDDAGFFANEPPVWADRYRIIPLRSNKCVLQSR